MAQEDFTAEMEKELGQRIMVLDGAMGTTIRTYGLDEAAARGARPVSWHRTMVHQHVLDRGAIRANGARRNKLGHSPTS